MKKRDDVIKELKPYCKLFKIKEYDYIIDEERGRELLRLNDTLIGCTGNSMLAIINELIAYVFVTKYCADRNIGHFQKQTLNVIKQYWVYDEATLSASFVTSIKINEDDTDESIIHAYWYDIDERENGEDVTATCSNCKVRGRVRTKRNSWGMWIINSPRCPECGAKMDKKK